MFHIFDSGLCFGQKYDVQIGEGLGSRIFRERHVPDAFGRDLRTYDALAGRIRHKDAAPAQFGTGERAADHQLSSPAIVRPLMEMARHIDLSGGEAGSEIRPSPRTG